MKSLSKQVAKGGIWSFALNITHRLLTLIRLVVLARLLAPDDFGLMGIALLFITALDKFSYMGFSAALIQKKGEVKEYLDIAWTSQVIRGLLLFGILIGSAPLVGVFFNAPKAIAIIRVIAFAEIFRGLTNIGIVFFRKELELNKQFIYKSCITVIDLLVSVVAALILRNAWALVYGLLAGQIVGCVMSYVIHPYRPVIRMDWSKFNELFNYGKWVLGYALTIFLATKADSFFVGKMLGVGALGFYQMAYRISNFVGHEIAEVISLVVFPTFSKLQENTEKLRKAFLHAFVLIAFISIPLSSGLILLGTDFTKLFLGEKWIPMILSMQIIAMSAPLSAIMRIFLPLFSGVGNPNLSFWMYFSRFSLMIIFLFPLTKNFGLVGAATSVLLGVLLSIPIWYYKVCKIINFNGYKMLKEIVPILISTLIMSGIIIMVKHFLGIIVMLDLLLLVIVSAVIYFSCLILFWLIFHCEPINSILLIKKSLQE